MQKTTVLKNIQQDVEKSYAKALLLLNEVYDELQALSPGKTYSELGEALAIQIDALVVATASLHDAKTAIETAFRQEDKITRKG